jgi:hypothetical protein
MTFSQKMMSVVRKFEMSFVLMAKPTLGNLDIILLASSAWVEVGTRKQTCKPVSPEHTHLIEDSPKIAAS